VRARIFLVHSRTAEAEESPVFVGSRVVLVHSRTAEAEESPVFVGARIIRLRSCAGVKGRPISAREAAATEARWGRGPREERPRRREAAS